MHTSCHSCFFFFPAWCYVTPDFDVLVNVHLSIFISVINQLDAQNFCFTISLFHAPTCFEHMCSSSGGQNCITHHHTYRRDDTRGCVIKFWPPVDEHMCSKHVGAWNKLIVKQKFLCIKLVNYWHKKWLLMFLLSGHPLFHPTVN